MDQMKCVKEYVAMENSGRQHKYTDADGESDNGNEAYINDDTSRDIRRMCLDKGRKEASRLIWGLSRNPVKLRQYLKTAQNFDHWKVAYRVGYEEYMNDLLETPTQIDRFTLKKDANDNDVMEVKLFGGDGTVSQSVASGSYIANKFRVCNCKNGKSYAVTVPNPTVDSNGDPIEGGCNGVNTVLGSADENTCKNGNLDYGKKCYEHKVKKPSDETDADKRERANFVWRYSNLVNVAEYYDGQTVDCPNE